MPLQKEEIKTLITEGNRGPERIDEAEQEIIERVFHLRRTAIIYIADDTSQ
jgi:hypothetical protein